MIIVLPIFFTVVLLFNFIPLPFDLPQIYFPLFETYVFLIFNFGFLFTLMDVVFYVCFD
ncbi:putative 2-hydroxy-palmitic acid dioxygenase Mpo1 [Helianthus anomalus]